MASRIVSRRNRCPDFRSHSIPGALQQQYLVLLVNIRACFELIQKPQPVARQETEQPEGALLRSVVRVERVQQDSLMTVEDTRAHTLGPPRLAPQLQKLVEHLALGAVQRAEKRLIEFADRLTQFAKQRAERFLAGIELACQPTRQELTLQGVPQ